MFDLKIEKDKIFNFRRMKNSDLRFFNTTRNEASKWLHNSETHTYKECVDWFAKNKNSFYYIVEFENIPIGYFRFSEIKNNSLYIGADINKNFRGKGYGKKIYEKIFKNLKASGYNVLYLEVLDFNERAIYLYRKLGFKEIKKIDLVHNNQKIVSLKMKKVL